MKGSTVFILLFVVLWTAGSVWAGVQMFEAIRSDGAIEVQVDGHDGGVAFVVPSFFAVRALRVANISCNEGRVWGRHDAQAWAPALRAALAELEAYDDVPLLEVEDDGNVVKMHKHNGRFVLEIEDGAERVKVVMPVRTVRRALEGV